MRHNKEGEGLCIVPLKSRPGIIDEIFVDKAMVCFHRIDEETFDMDVVEEGGPEYCFRFLGGNLEVSLRKYPFMGSHSEFYFPDDWHIEILSMHVEQMDDDDYWINIRFLDQDNNGNDSNLDGHITGTTVDLFINPPGWY